MVELQSLLATQIQKKWTSLRSALATIWHWFWKIMCLLPSLRISQLLLKKTTQAAKTGKRLMKRGLLFLVLPMRNALNRLTDRLA